MNWYALRPWAGTVARLVVGGIWIWASLSKIGSPRTFTEAVRAYDATPEWLSEAIGYGLPVLEFVIGVLLVVGLVTRLVAAVSAVLFVVFLIGLIQAAARGIQLECGCFGGGGASGGTTEYTLDILRDVGLLVLAGFVAWWPMTRLSADELLARGDHVETPSAKRLRSDQGRRKYEAAVASAQRRARVRAWWLNGSIAGVVVLIAVVGIGVQAGRAKIQGSLTASHASVSDGVVYGSAKAPAKVQVYEDFQCPHCLAFEQSAGATLRSLVAAGKAQVQYHPIAILDASSDGNRYSSRAANAALCASDISVADFVAYHDILYGTVHGAQVQPQEGSDGRTDAQLVSYGKDAGITGTKLQTFATCVQEQTHKALVEALTERASQDGISATPTIKVDGKSITPTKAALTKAISTAV